MFPEEVSCISEQIVGMRVIYLVLRLGSSVVLIGVYGDDSSDVSIDDRPTVALQ
jgi:hypothetical protein